MIINIQIFVYKNVHKLIIIKIMMNKINVQIIVNIYGEKLMVKIFVI